MLKWELNYYKIHKSIELKTRQRKIVAFLIIYFMYKAFSFVGILYFVVDLINRI